MTVTRVLLISLFGIFLLPFSSCEEYDEKQVTIAGGKLDQVMMIMQDTLVETSISDSIAMEFSAPIPIMPQGEPKFLINIRDYSRYQGASSVFHKYRNLMFFSLVKGNAPITKFVRKQLGDDKVKEMIKNEQLFTVRKNEFAQQQQVIYIVAADRATFYRLFEEQKEELFKTIRKFSNHRLTKQTFMEGEQMNASKAIEREFGFTMRIPRQFLIMQDSNNVVWLTKETIFRNKQDVQVKKIREDFYITSYKGKQKQKYLEASSATITRWDMVKEAYPFIIMDSIAADHIHGTSELYPIYIDKEQPLWQEERNISGIQTLDSRGLWRCDNPFMGGFFYTISFEHPTTDELIVIFGYVYAAGSDKRPIHRKYDVIYNSIKPTEKS